MLTLVKEGKNPNAIVPIVKTTGKKRTRPVATVYFSHNMKDDNKNVAPAKPTLTLHRSHIKKHNQISEQEYTHICEMIDSLEEPDVGHPLRKAYWDIRDRYETSLMREMYIGDQQDLKFQLDLPKKVKDWPGTYTAFGSSGAGKTYYVVSMIERYLKSVGSGAPVRAVIWLSPEEKIDKTLRPLKQQKWREYYYGIDISEKAVKEAKMGAEQYFEERIKSVIDKHGENALIVFDDFVDAAPGLYNPLERLYNSSLRVARHMNSGIFSLQHTYAGHRATSQSLQSNRYIIFFPRSQQQRCTMFLKDHLQIPTPEAKVLVKRFASLARSMVVQMHSPVCIFNEKYLLLI